MKFGFSDSKTAYGELSKGLTRIVFDILAVISITSVTFYIINVLRLAGVSDSENPFTSTQLFQ